MLKIYFGVDYFDIYVLNKNQLVHSMEELIMIATTYL